MDKVGVCFGSDPSEERPAAKQGLIRFWMVSPVFRGSSLIAERVDQDSEVFHALDLFAEPYAQGRYDDVLPVAETAFGLNERAFGAERHSTATTLDETAQLRRARCQQTKAEPLSRNALACFEKRPGSEHPKLAAIRKNCTTQLRASAHAHEAKRRLNP